MKIQLSHSYPKLVDGKLKLDQSGDPIICFFYRVTGTKEELAQYEELRTADGHNCKDTNGYYYVSTNPVGTYAELRISTNGKIYVDTTNLDLAKALVKKHGAVGQMMARDILNHGTNPQGQE